MFKAGSQVEILERGEWVGPFMVTALTGRTSDHLVLSGPSGLFEQYNDVYKDASLNVRLYEGGTR